MFRGAIALLLLSLGAIPVLAGGVQSLIPLPNDAISIAIQLDSAGNIFVVGRCVPPSPRSLKDTRDAFVAKLSPDGSALRYFTVIGGSADETADALAVAPDGSVYVAGDTGSFDFPVTSSALQPKMGAPDISQGFLVKLDSSGSMVYATFLGGAAPTLATGIVLNSAGEVFVSGRGETGLPAGGGTPGGGPGGFLLKMDAGLTRPLLSINGYGGRIALDDRGNIYLAGAASAGATDHLPTLSPDAFQPTYASRFCSATSGPPALAIPCNYQYVAKIDAAGTRLLWATYVTGTYGASAAAVAVDAQGNVILAGTTNSDDYPVTAGGFQTAYAPAAPLLPNSAFSSTRPPAATGYITKLNAAGTHLEWSTYFGGSNAEQLTGMAVGPSGVIYVSGRSGSNDLPVMIGTPVPCRPQANQVVGFVARIASDGSAAGASQLVYGEPACLYSSCSATVRGFDFTGWPLALRSDGTAVIAGVHGSLANLDFSFPGRLACVGDAADRAQLSSVAPGQLISIFGADLAFPSVYKQPAAVVPSTDSFGVFFNGMPAPILYSSGGQINVQVPYEIAGQDRVRMHVVNTQVTLPLSETLTLGVVERRPSVFLADPVVEGPIAGFSVCGTSLTLGIAPVAVNADGTLNDCANPAPAGSTVTIFVNGLGPTSPALTTGAIASGPPVPLSPSLDIGATMTAPGTIVGVAQVQIQLPAQVGFTQAFQPSLEGSPLPEQPLIIWTRPN